MRALNAELCDKRMRTRNAINRNVRAGNVMEEFKSASNECGFICDKRMRARSKEFQLESASIMNALKNASNDWIAND